MQVLLLTRLHRIMGVPSESELAYDTFKEHLWFMSSSFYRVGCKERGVKDAHGQHCLLNLEDHELGRVVFSLPPSSALALDLRQPLLLFNHHYSSTVHAQICPQRWYSGLFITDEESFQDLQNSSLGVRNTSSAPNLARRNEKWRPQAKQDKPLRYLGWSTHNSGVSSEQKSEE